MAVEILERGARAASLPPRTPPRGPFMVNRRRAEMLGLVLDYDHSIIEEIVDEALALDDQPSAAKAR
jgi:hypothetical protein